MIVPSGNRVRLVASRGRRAVLPSRAGNGGCGYRGLQLRALVTTSSRSVSPATMVARAASAGSIRSPGSDTLNRSSDTHDGRQLEDPSAKRCCALAALTKEDHPLADPWTTREVVYQPTRRPAAPSTPD